MSNGALATIGIVFLAFFILGAANKVISRIMGLVGLLLLIVVAIQLKTGTVLIDFSQLGNSIVHLGLRISQWAEESLWPSLTELARWIESALD